MNLNYFKYTLFFEIAFCLCKTVLGKPVENNYDTLIYRTNELFKETRKVRDTYGESMLKNDASIFKVLHYQSLKVNNQKKLLNAVKLHQYTETFINIESALKLMASKSDQISIGSLVVENSYFYKNVMLNLLNKFKVSSQNIKKSFDTSRMYKHTERFFKKKNITKTTSYRDRVMIYAILNQQATFLHKLSLFLIKSRRYLPQ